MDQECDLEAAELGEKRQSQQEANSETGTNFPIPGNTVQHRTVGDSELEPLPSHQNEGMSQGPVGTAEKCEGLRVSVEISTALGTDGVNWPLKASSRDCLAREPLLNEHFNNPLPQRSQYTVSRTVETDGHSGGTLGSTCQDSGSGFEPVQDDSGSVVDECPICSEPYRSQGDHSMTLLNCDHSLCQRCLATLVKRAADCSRVQCPLCRQKTPLLQWEVYRLQEDTAFSSVPPNSSMPMLVRSDPGTEAEPPAPGLCSVLEQRLLERAETARVCGCFEHPRWTMRLARAMQHRSRCRCCYLALLVAMYLAELTFLLLVFLPVIVLVILFTVAS
ncbi:uncharacterized protein [Hoplias malabaricus]|uniref:uncharacterized protein n=1 Tax=Hoplias malabaricus TaxID=27720 RepID=UPI003461D764